MRLTHLIQGSCCIMYASRRADTYPALVGDNSRRQLAKNYRKVSSGCRRFKTLGFSALCISKETKGENVLKTILSSEQIADLGPSSWAQRRPARRSFSSSNREEDQKASLIRLQQARGNTFLFDLKNATSRMCCRPYWPQSPRPWVQ